jgi:uncharacterized protein YegP (UPF0339 family)
MRMMESIGTPAVFEANVSQFKMYLYALKTKTIISSEVYRLTSQSIHVHH